MSKKPSGQTSKRMRREDPDRETPDRSASEHIRRNARSNSNGKPDNGDAQSNARISKTVQQAISGMVQQSSAFIEEQIRAGQLAAERLRDGIANSKELNTDINTLVEHLVATTKDVGTTWLELISIIVRALGTQPSNGGGSNGGGRPHAPPGPGATVTRSGKSGATTTFSSMTPAESSVPGVAPRIVVNGPNVKSVALDLRPPSLQFTPVVQRLTAGDRNHSGIAGYAHPIDAKFSRSPDEAGITLTVNVPDGQAPGIYTGAVVDSKTNQAGGTLSVTVAD